MTITLRPRTTVIFLGAIVCVLFVAHVATVVSRYYSGHDYVRGLVPMFDMYEEQNVPTYFTTVQLLLCACLSFVIGVAERNRRGRGFRHWMGLGIILLFMSLDELVGIHERLVNPVVRPFSHASQTQQPFYVSWMIPYTVLIALVGLSFVRFVLKLPADIRRLVVASGSLYIAGAFVVEGFKGYYLARYCHWQKDIIYDLMVLCAETLEMVGIVVLVYALMSYINRYLDNLALRITSSSTD